MEKLKVINVGVNRKTRCDIKLGRKKTVFEAKTFVCNKGYHLFQKILPKLNSIKNEFLQNLRHKQQVPKRTLKRKWPTKMGPKQHVNNRAMSKL